VGTRWRTATSSNSTRDGTSAHRCRHREDGTETSSPSDIAGIGFSALEAVTNVRQTKECCLSPMLGGASNRSAGVCDLRGLRGRNARETENAGPPAATTIR
jgi:hypothetical protein